MNKNNLNVIGIIPARMASTRFPGKPLAKIRGIPMLGHVYIRSKMSKLLDDVYIATPDKVIADYIESIGAKAIMTSDTHERASDRTAEAVLKIEKNTGKNIDIVVMIQGDEPMVYPQMIDEAIKPLADKDIYVTNLMAPLKSRQEKEDPNQVKIVFDLENNALYFSREPIPSSKKSDKEVPMFRQVPIIPFKRDFLIKFNELAPTPLEVIESVDMMRLIEHKYKVRMVPTEFTTYSVDTIDDLHKVEKIMGKDPLIEKYNIKKGEQ